MPELPEVETVRRDLQRFVLGAFVETVEVGRERAVRRSSRAEVIDRLSGTTFVAMRRRGKYLLADLDSGDCMMVHLRMSGQLLLAPPGTPRPAHTHVTLHLLLATGERAELRFVDPRTFGEVVVFDPERVGVELPGLARLGVDPIEDAFELSTLRNLLRSQRQIKALLLDQHVIAGLGNIYCDEVLHRSRIHPARPAADVSRAGATRLYAAIIEVLGAAIDAGGSSLRDAQYVDLSGEAGSFQEDHLVYGRYGETCRTCARRTIARMTIAGRSTHFCPGCQPLRTPTRGSGRSGGDGSLT